MRKAFKYRIYLTNGQRRMLERQLEECRWLYNETLAYRKNAWDQEQRSADWYETKRRIPLLKEDRPSLKAVHSQVLQNVTERVDLAFKAFFRRVQAGDADVGLAAFATLSDGEEIANPRFYRRDEADLKRVQKLKDAAKNAQRWDENRRRGTALAHIHERIAHRRGDFAHKRSRELIGRYQVIVFEQLAPLEMGRSRGMRKSILDVAWSQFISMTLAKAEEAGRQVVLVNPRNTSKLCSSCGKLVQKTLSDRTHTCPHCGLVMGRDHNAALNILHRGLQTLRL